MLCRAGSGAAAEKRCEGRGGWGYRREPRRRQSGGDGKGIMGVGEQVESETLMRNSRIPASDLLSHRHLGLQRMKCAGPSDLLYACMSPPGSLS